MAEENARSIIVDARREAQRLESLEIARDFPELAFSQLPLNEVLARANNETGRILNSMARTGFLQSRRNTGNAVAHFGTGSRGIIQRQRFSRKSGVMKASVANRIGVDGQIISVSSTARNELGYRIHLRIYTRAIRQIRFVERMIIVRERANVGVSIPKMDLLVRSEGIGGVRSNESYRVRLWQGIGLQVGLIRLARRC